MNELRQALRAIAARVDQRFDDPSLVPYLPHISDGDDGPEKCAVDCRTIATMVLSNSAEGLRA